MHTFSPLLALSALVFPLTLGVSAADPAARAMPQEREAAARLQVFLDRASFGPGKIDGRYGGFTQKALTLYREAQGMPPVASAASTEKPAAAEKAHADHAAAGKPNKKIDPAAAEGPAKDGMIKEEEPKPGTEQPLPLPDLKDMDLKSTEPVFIDYQVTEADQKAVGNMPTEIAAMAEVKWLPYATLGEMVAEKFHCDIDFLKELNPGKVDGLKPGDTVKVPNVEPFDVAGVKDLPLLDQLAMSREDAEKANDAERGGGKKEKVSSKNPGSKKDGGKNAGARGRDKNGSLASSKAGEAYEPSSNPPAGAPPSSAAAIPEASQIAVEVNTKDNMLRLLENGKLVAAYPVTIGSDETKSPQGEWKVRGIARLPDFRYDSSFLKTGERGDKTYLLPPGPNNLVGVVWIALNRRGIGLHGTGEPDSIGRSASHGCVRLANWDIVRLATHVRAGVTVSIH